MVDNQTMLLTTLNEGKEGWVKTSGKGRTLNGTTFTIEPLRNYSEVEKVVWAGGRHQEALCPSPVPLGSPGPKNGEKDPHTFTYP